MALPKDFSFLFLGNSTFRGLYHRERVFATELALGGYPVTFVEEMPSAASRVRSFLRRLASSSGVESAPDPEHIPAGLTVLTPPFVPTFFRSSLTPAADRRRFRRWFRDTFSDQDWSRTVLIVGLPYWWYGFVTRPDCPGALVVYDMYDALEMPSRTPKALERMKRAERSLGAECDLITYSARGMETRVADEFPKKPSLFLANGVSPVFFRNAGSRPDRSRNIIGYVGSVDPRWVDRDLLLRVAADFPDSEVVIRASLDRGFKRQLLRYRNVRIVPFSTYADVAGLMHTFSVSLIPFKRNVISDLVNPQKLYEYCATGHPVVATRTKELEHYAGYVYLAGDHDEFIRCVKEALEEDAPDRRAERVRFAESNSWSSRVAALLSFLESHSAR